MTDLNRLIAEADPDGKLGKVREYVEWQKLDSCQGKPCDDCRYLDLCADDPDCRSDAALAEALAVIVRQGKELERLMVCGNCQCWSMGGGPSACFSQAHYEPGTGWDSLLAVQPSDHCHLSPSQWTERVL
jgi:hypothetical protein